MSSRQLLLITLIAFLVIPTHQKIFNILRCDVRGNVIYECDGTITPVTPLHEKILNDYMDRLAAYYRVLYSSVPTAQTNNQINSDPIQALKEPEYPQYPQMCKICQDD